MGDSNDSPVPSNELPEALTEQLETLSPAELESVLSYVEHLLETSKTPIEEDIEASAAGEIIKIENHGAYALVQKHPPDGDGSDANTDIVSQYHVRREPHLDGTERLHWTYIGDVDNVEEVRCTACGGRLDKTASVCPHCGSENVHNAGTEE